MNDDILALLVLYVPLLVVAVIFRAFSPKNINWAYGYRTQRSQTNQKSWDYAQKQASRLMLWNILAVIFSQVVVFFTLRAFGIEEFSATALFSMIVFLAGLVWLFISTEKQLKILNRDKK